MSYDILLYPRTPGQDWASVLAADEEDTPDHVTGDPALLESGVATFRIIASRLDRFLTGAVETWVAEETGGDVLGELTETDSGLQVELFHGSASVSFPYRDREDREAFSSRVREAVRIVAEETGYEAYDPQREASFDGTIDDGPGIAALRLGSGPAAGESPDAGATTTGTPAQVDPTDSPTEDPTGRPLKRQLPPRTPEQVQRRAIIDLVLGVALISYAVWRRNSGDTGILMTIILILGGMNLFGGFMSLFAAKRLRDRAAEGTGGDAPQVGQPPT